MEPKTMSVLVFLASRAGDAVAREELEAAVWAGTVVGYDALSNAVIKLRKAFGDKARAPRVIETISKGGYRLIADVSFDAPLDSPEGGQALPRKLVAVLYADVAGYSRLTSADEDATHRSLGTCLDLISSLVDRHRGRITHYAGDAVLAIFSAAVDAVGCAIEAQREVSARNDAYPPERRVQFRIGVNLGDVIEDRGDVYGDGVNVAARLEQLAEPGGVAVSDAVRTAVGNRLAIEFHPAGQHRVKNIPEPVRVFHAAPPGEANPPAAPAEAAVLDLPDKPSVAVLAFDNMCDDPEQEYFSDGVAEDIITDLSKISGLFVIARNSSFSYKGSQANIEQVSRDLGVRFVLEGSVRKAGNRVRISAQLIDGTTGGHVWAERYDRELTDIFAVQDEVTREIVAALAPTLTTTDRHRLQCGAAAPQSDAAYDYFLRGREQDQRDTREANRCARELLDEAIALDPTFSLAHSHSSRSHLVCFINRWADSVEGFTELAIDRGRRAVELDENNAHAQFALGCALLWTRQHQPALRAIESAIEIDANFAEGHAALGMAMTYMGEPTKAVASLKTAMRLDPHYRDAYLHLIAQAYFHSGEYEAAVSALQRRLVRKPDSDTSRVLLASAYGHLGEMAESRAQWAEALSTNPEYSLEHRRRALPYRDERDFEHFVDGLRKAGLPDSWVDNRSYDRDG